MLTFSEYLQEMRMLKKIKEDAVLQKGTSNVASTDVVSSTNAVPRTSDVISSKDAAIPMTDHSVLGCPKKDKGFLGVNDFFIPKNMLSGNNSTILKRIN